MWLLSKTKDLIINNVITIDTLNRKLGSYIGTAENEVHCFFTGSELKKANPAGRKTTAQRQMLLRKDKVAGCGGNQRHACTDRPSLILLLLTAVCVYVLCSGPTHAQSHTAHFVQLSFTYLPVTIETQQRRMLKAGW